jgi:hypothetical protein
LPNGAYQESPEGFLALLFLPIAWGYYKLPSTICWWQTAAAIGGCHPMSLTLRNGLGAVQSLSGRTYRDFRSSGSGESALSLLLQEKTLEDVQQFRVDYLRSLPNLVSKFGMRITRISNRQFIECR